MYVFVFLFDLHACHLCGFQSKIHFNLASFPTYSGDAVAFGCLRRAWLEEKSMYDK